MNNISVTPKGGTIASELSGNQVNLTAPSLVKLNLNQADIKAFTRNGNDLVVTTKSGETLVIHNFYGPNGESDLVLQDSQGALWWVEDPGTEGFHYVSIDSTDALLAEDGLSENTIIGLAAGAALLGGAAALIGSSHGGGDSDDDNNNNGSGDNNGDGDNGGGNNGGGNNGGGDNGGGDNGGGDNGGGDNGGGDNGGGGGEEDTTPPSPVADLLITDDVGAVVGPIVTGTTTDDNTPTLSGTAEAGSTVNIYDGSTLIGTATVGEDGTWSFTTDVLAEGEHSLTVTVTDAAGNTSAATDPITFIVDSLAPDAIGDLTVINNEGAVAVLVTPDSATNDNTPVISGTAEVGSTVTLTDGDAVLGTVIVGADGTWSFTSPALGDGSHTLSITATDAIGNVSPATTITFTVDTLPPDAVTDLVVTADEGGLPGPLTSGAETDDSTLVFTGTAEPGTTVSFYDGDTLLGSTIVNDDRSWTFTSDALTNGPHSITTTVTDAAGNVSPASDAFVVNIDAALPPATLTLEVTDDTGSTLVLLNDGDYTRDNTPTLSGLTAANATVVIYNGDVELATVTSDANGQWQYDTTALADGTYVFHATTTDGDGNVTDSDDISITIDTVVPDAAADLVLNNDEGSTYVPVVAGGATNDDTPVLTGTAEPGTTVTITDGDTQLGTVVVGDDGTWSFTTPTLNEGDHSITTTVTDQAGNVSTPSDPITFTVDTTVPVAATGLTVTDDVGDVVGALASGDTTDDSTPTLSGQAEANSTVNVYDGTTLLGTVPADADGNWTFTPTGLSNGDHSITVTVTDAAGNVSAATDAFTFTVDADLPPATSSLQITDDSGSTLVLLVNGASTNDSTPILSGLTGANNTVVIYNSGTEIGNVKADANGQWQFTPAALPDGTYIFHATATDAAGNAADSGNITITIDTLVPDAAGDVVLSNDEGATPVPVTAGGATSDTTPVLSGTAEPGTTVNVLDGTTVIGTAPVDADGNWSFTAPVLTEGDHSLTTTVTDAAGNTSLASDPITFTVDTQPPAAAVSLVFNDDQSGTLVPITTGSTNDTTPVLTGWAEIGSTVTITVDGGTPDTVTVDADGNWSYTLPTLDEGDHTVTTSVTDAAGNVSPAADPIVINIDLTPPAAADGVTLTNDAGDDIGTAGITNDVTPTLSGTAEPGSTVTVSDGDTELGTTTVGDDGTWSFTAPVLGEGDHTITATVTDPAGNASPATDPVTFTVDITTPDVATDITITNDSVDPVVIVTNGATNDTTPVLSGTAEPGSTVSVFVDGDPVAVGTAPVGDDGSWTFTPTAPLAEGAHTITTTVTDPAGNTSIASEPINLTIDTVAPTAPDAVLLNDNEGSTLVPILDGTTTNDSTPVFSGAAGSAEPGSTINVFDGNAPIGTATVEPDGSWSVTLPVLGEGTHVLTATAVDLAGNEGPASTAITFTVDTVAPDAPTDLTFSNDDGAAPVDIANGGVTNDNTPLLQGTAEANSVVSILEDGVLLDTVTSDANGNWSYSPTLTDGTHSFTVTVTDAVGNVSDASAPITLTVDTVPPVVADLALSNNLATDPVAIPDGGLSNDPTPVISGTAEAGSTITIYDGADLTAAPLGTVVVDDTGIWTFTVPDAALLADGLHALNVTATDPAGNVSAPAVINVEIDTAVPDAPDALAVDSDNGTAVVINADGTFTTDSTPLISGTGEPGSIINVLNGTDVVGTATVGDNGEFTVTLTTELDDGTYNLTVQAVDAAGNVSDAATITFTVDATAPDATEITISNNNVTPATDLAEGATTNDNTPLLSGAAEAGSTVTIYSEDDQIIGTTVTLADGTWTFQSPTLTDDTHGFYATVTDVAGNVSENSPTFTLTVDATAPEPIADLLVQNDEDGALVTITNGGLTNDATPVISGTAEPGSTITLVNAADGTPFGTATADATTGAWSFTPDALAEGDYNLSITVTDEAGNVSAATTVGFTVDLTPPDVIDVGDFALYNNDGSSLVVIANGGLTNDATPELAGTGAPGTTINIYQDGVQVGTAAVSAAGDWVFQTGTLANDTPVAFTVSAVDAAGNESAQSAAYTITVDAVIPAPVSDLQVTDDVGGVQGALLNNAVTDDNTPTFSGTAEAGTTVSVYEGDTLLGTALVGDDLTWTITPVALGNGLHDFSVIVTDLAGNVSAVTPFTLDVEAGIPPATSTLQITDDEGTTLVALGEGANTNDNTPVLSGLSTAGSTIAVIIDGVTVTTILVGADNQWNYTPAALDDGIHTFAITTTDPVAGTTIPTGPITLTIDTAAPNTAIDLLVTNDDAATPIEITAGSFTNDNTPLVSGTAEPGATVTLYDGTVIIGSVVADATTGAWALNTPALSQGAHALSVTVTDLAGNVSAPSATLNFTVDTAVPTAVTLVVSNDDGATPVIIPNGGSTNDATPLLSGVAEDGATVTIFDAGVEIGSVAVAGGTWSFNAALGEGPHTLTVTATDAAGNVSVASSATTIIVDTVAPGAVTIAASNNNGTVAVPIADNGSTNDTTPALTGTAEAGSTVTILQDGAQVGTVIAGAGGTWSFVSATLADGAYTFTATATDAAGNVSPAATLTLNVLTAAVAPITDLTVTDDVDPITGILANGATTNDTTPTLAGTATAAGNIVTIYDGTDVLGTVVAGAGGVWTFTTDALTNGLHPLSVTVTDAAGNVSAATNFPITVDTIAPTASTLVVTNDVANTVVPNGGTTGDSTPTLSGVAEANSTITITENGAPVGTTTADADGVWSLTTGVLAEGAHPLTVTVTDAAGNVSGATTATVNIDTTAPAAVIFTAGNNNAAVVTAIANNGITNDSTPVLTGTAEGGSLVTILDGTNVLGTVTASATGEWSFTTTTLGEGLHTLNVTATDAVGNVSPAASITFTVDTLAPAPVTGLTITDNVGINIGGLLTGAFTDDNTPTLAGTAAANALVTILDGATVLGTVVADGAGAWSFTPTALTEGAHSLSVTTTDAAGNVSAATTPVAITVDTIAPTAVVDLAVNTAGTTLTGTGEANSTITVRDAGGAIIGTGTAGAGGAFTVNLDTPQTTGAQLSVTQTDLAGNVSPAATVGSAIQVVAVADTIEVDYTTTLASVNNALTTQTSAALVTVGLGPILSATIIGNSNPLTFSVGADDTRSVSVNATLGGVLGLLVNYSLNVYQQQADGSYTLVQSIGNYFAGILSLGAHTGQTIALNPLGTGNYAVVLASNLNVSVLPVTTIRTTSDVTTLAVTVAATVTGNLLDNDTSSDTGVIPANTLVTNVEGGAVAADGNTTINTNYGTLIVDSHGQYTYTLKGGLDIDTLPASETFTYSVTDAAGAVTSSTLTVNLSDGAVTTLAATNSLFAESMETTSDASGSIYGDATETHNGTLSIFNENGDQTTVSSTGTTTVAGDYGVLSIAANGAYTYSLNADVSAQNITHKEVFNYSLAATDGTITQNSFTIDLHPTVTGTAAAETLSGGAYDDTITAGAGADTLVYHLLATADSTGGNGHDTWTDFNVAQGDKIDVSELLIGWNDSTSNVNDFVSVNHTTDGNTVLSIDRDGSGTAFSSAQLVTLEGVNASLEELLQQPHQTTTA